MPLALVGLGTALPAHAITQSQWVNLAGNYCPPDRETVPTATLVSRRSGIEKRYSVVVEPRPEGTVEVPFFPPLSPDNPRGPTTGQRMAHYARVAPRLACRAAQGALEHARISPTDVTHLITVSCTGFTSPSLDVQLVRELRLPETVCRTHLAFMGCHGAINGLRVAHAVTGADPSTCVLVCAVEIGSLHLHYGSQAQMLVANSLFADGAGAVVGTAVTDSSADVWKVRATGSCVIPQTENVMAWQIGDHGFEMTLSPRIPGTIRQHLRPWLVAWLGKHGVSLATVGSWAVHPGGPRILQAVEDSLELPPTALAVSRAVLAECGNMSSPTVLYILERLQSLRASRPCVVLGFGPGLAVEALLIE